MALLIARTKTDLELGQLKEILLEVHAVMQQMVEVERAVGHRSLRRYEREDKLG